MNRGGRRFLLATIGAVAMLVLVISTVFAQTTLTTTLSGAEEAQAADPNAKGFISLELHEDGTVCYTAKLQGISDDTLILGHIHGQAGPGVNAPPVIDLMPTEADRHGNEISNCVTGDPAVVAAVVATPSMYYVNFHTDVWPAGAMRGQLGD